MISVTIKAYDILPYTSFNFAYSTTGDSDTFWTMIAYFHNQLPRLVKSGLMGYFWVTPFDAKEPNTTMQGKLYGEWLAPNMNLDQVRQLLNPMEEHIKLAKFPDTISVSGNGEKYPDYTKGFATNNDPDTAGIPVRLGSRLLDEQSLSKPIAELKETLRAASGGSARWPILGHVIAGPGTWSPKGGIAGGSNAVLPAWRKAFMQMGKHSSAQCYTHALTQPSTALPRSWDPLNQTQFDQITTSLRTEEAQVLRDLAPNMGAYVSEADPTEPNWKDTFYGNHYPRVLAIKQRWDPDGVFWYKNAVGSELWEPEGQHGIENGVGQKPMQLCKVKDDM